MFKKKTLPNGLRLITAPMKNSETVAVLVLVATGSKYETKEINGISHFLEHMFFKGTKKRPNARAVAEVLDRVGGEYNAFTGKEYTGYWAKVGAENLDLALDWVADILLNSKFNAKEIEKERGVIVEELNMYLDTPMRYVSELWEQLLYGDQPAGWEIVGTRETIAKISRQNFLDYFKNHYRAQNSILVVAGKFNENALLKKAAGYFNRAAEGGGADKLPTKESQQKPEALIYFKETDQTHLCLGTRAYDIFDQRRWATSVLATILGGMMSSRLFTSIREKKGLAYYIRTANEQYTDAGFLVSQAGVANARAKEAVTEILKEYALIRDKKVGLSELKKAKDNIKGSLRLSLETSDEIGSWLGAQEILQKNILTPKEVLTKIEAIGASQVQAVARDIFQPEKLNLALIGPFKEKGEFEEILKI